MDQRSVANVTQIIDEERIKPFQILAIVLCSLVAFLDGLDSQSIAVAAPIIAGNLNLARSALGPVFSAGLLGAMIGALTFGPLADRFGRKRMLVAAAFLFGVFTILTAQANSLESLLAVRFAAGLGLGGATPCFISLAAEYAPKRRRAMVSSLIWAAFPLGGTVGGFLNAYILAELGWQNLFYVGGFLPIVVACILIVWLPESVRFLIATGADQERIGRIMRKIRPETPAGVRWAADEERVVGVPLKQLFAGGRLALTLLLWVPFFTAFGTLGIAVLWTPTLLVGNGIAPSQAAIALGVHGIGSLLGMSLAGRLLERFGPVALLTPALILGAAATAAIGYAASSVPLMAGTLFLVGLFVGTGASGSIALATLAYPTAIRSSGIGWAMGMGRFGQVLGPLFAGAVVAAGWSSVQLFYVIAVAPLLGALAILVLVRGADRSSGRAAMADSPAR